MTLLLLALLAAQDFQKSAAEAGERISEALKTGDPKLMVERVRADRRYVLDAAGKLFRTSEASLLRGGPPDQTLIERLLQAFESLPDLDEHEKKQRTAIRGRVVCFARLTPNGRTSYREHLLLIGDLMKALEAKDYARAEALERLYRAGMRRFGDLLASSYGVMALSGSYADSGRTVPAIAQYEILLEVYRETGDRVREGAILGRLGVLYSNVGRAGDSLRTQQEALQILLDKGDALLAAYSRQNIATALFHLSRYEEGIRNLEEALPIVRQAGQRHPEAVILHNLGEGHHKLGRLQEALRLHEESLAIMRAIPHRGGESTALSGTGKVLADLGRFAEAKTALGQALEIKRELKDALGVVSVLGSLAYVANIYGQYPEARDFYQKALALSREIQAPDEEASALNALAKIEGRLGRRALALALLKQALELRRRTGDRSGEAVTLTDLASICSETGEFRSALQHYSEALKIFHETGERLSEAGILGNQGVLYSTLGRYDEALRCYEANLEVIRAAGDRHGESVALGNLGLLRQHRGELDLARPHLDRALLLEREMGDRPGEATVLGSLGSLEHELGRADEALRLYEAALKIHRELGHSTSIAATLNNIGLLHADRGDLNRCLASIDEALTLHRDAGDRDGLQYARANRGYVLLSAGRVKEALVELDQAIVLAEDLRASMGMLEAEKESYLSRRRRVYELAAMARLTLGQPAQAFELLERLRARNLMDSLGGAGLKRVPPELLEKKAMLVTALNVQRGKIRGLERSAGTPAAERDAERLKLPPLEKDLADVSREIELKRNLEEVHPAGAEQIQARLADDEALVVYNVVESSHDDAFARTPEKIMIAVLTRRAIEFVQVPKEKRFADDVALFRRGAVASGSGYPVAAFKSRARRLYETLLKPIEAKLQGIRALVIAPDEMLYSVPFEAFVATDKGGTYAELDYLGRRFEVNYVSSGTLFARRRGEPAGAIGDRFVGFGDPDYGTLATRPERGQALKEEEEFKAFPLVRGGDTWTRLPRSGEEVLRVSELFPQKEIHLQKDASERRAKSLAPAGILHFACHGMIDGTQPMKSALVLRSDGENDGYLEAREIADLNFTANLVVLSACDSGVGEMLRGEGLIGLTRGFMMAGARSVLSSLWTVADEGGMEFMVKFYGRLVKGTGVRAALTQTKREMMEHPKYSAPYSWAGFVLHGD